MDKSDVRQAFQAYAQACELLDHWWPCVLVVVADEELKCGPVTLGPGANMHTKNCALE